MKTGSLNIVFILAFAIIAGNVYYYFFKVTPVVESEIRTAYQVFCASPALTLSECNAIDTAVAVNFKIDVEKQVVLRWYEDLGEDPTPLNNCVVVSKENWACDSSPGTQAGTRNGYHDGVYFEYSGLDVGSAQGYLLTVNKAEWEEIHKRLYP